VDVVDAAARDRWVPGPEIPMCAPISSRSCFRNRHGHRPGAYIVYYWLTATDCPGNLQPRAAWTTAASQRCTRRTGHKTQLSPDTWSHTIPPDRA